MRRARLIEQKVHYTVLAIESAPKSHASLKSAYLPNMLGHRLLPTLLGGHIRQVVKLDGLVAHAHPKSAIISLIYCRAGKKLENVGRLIRSWKVGPKEVCEPSHVSSPRLDAQQKVAKVRTQDKGFPRMS
jgi:hypothetical protein